MEFNFDGKKASSDTSGSLFTPIGIIDVFEITDVIFAVNDNGNENFEIHFKREEDTFRDYFYLTENAVPKFLNLFKKFTGMDVPPDSEQGIKAALMGKKSGLRVWGKINSTNGKVNACLNFGGFAFPAEELSTTSWKPWEEKKIAEFQNALEVYLENKKSGATSSGPPPPSSSDMPEDTSKADKF